MTTGSPRSPEGEAPGVTGRSHGGSWLVCLLIVTATLAVYWPVRHFEFLNYDDQDGISNHPVIRSGLSFHGAAWAFQNSHMANWQPLTSLSHMLDCQLFGLNAGPHHLVNLFFHLANTVLLFLGLRQLTGADGRSAFVAALFALHPLHVESVAWVSERKDVLSTFFFLLTLGAYVQYARFRAPEQQRAAQHRAALFTSRQSRFTPHAAFFYALALLLFACGLMSKPMLVTLPFVLLLLDLWPLQRLQPNAQRSAFKASLPLVWEKVPFFALAFAISGITLLTQSRSRAVAALADWPLSSRVANSLVSYVRYIQKMFWPQGLVAYYPRVSHWPAWQVVGAAFFLAAATFGVIRLVRHRPFLAFGWLWYLGTLVPVIGLVQVGDQAMADRYTYIPLTGLFVMLAWGGADLLQFRPCPGARVPAGPIRARSRDAPAQTVPPIGSRRLLSKPPRYLPAAAALLACLFLTRNQVGYWRDSLTLFRHVLSVLPNVALAHNNVGAALYDQGKLDEAIVSFKAALQLKPQYADAHNNLGLALWRHGQDQDAIDQFTAVLNQGPDAKAYYNLGVVLLNQEKIDQAKQCFLAALKLEPDHAQAHNNLGNVLLSQGKLDEAMEQFAAAVRCAPHLVEARCNLAQLLAHRGVAGKAIEQYAAALRAKPDCTEAHLGLAGLLEETGQLADAARHYAAAAQLQPSLAEAHNDLSNLAARLNDPQTALTHGRAAVKLKPQWPEAHYNLANALLLQNKLEEAVAQYSEALRLKTNYFEAHQNLGFALERLGHDKEAAEQYAELVRIRPDFAVAFSRLAAVLARQGRLEEAVKAAEEGIRQAVATGQANLASQLREDLLRYRLGPR